MRILEFPCPGMTHNTILAIMPLLSSCSYYPEQIRLKMAKLEFENHKNQYFSGCLDPNKLRPIFLEIAWQNWPFKIGLSLFDFKQLLVDSGIIVHCNHPKEQYPCKCRSRARKAGKERRLSNGSIARVCYCALAATTLLLPQLVLGCSVCGCVTLYFSKVQTVWIW